MEILEKYKPITKIVDDFGNVMEYMFKNQSKISETTSNIGMKDLFALNKTLIFTEMNAKPSYFQDMYPAIDLIIQIAKQGGLIKMEYKKSKLLYIPTPKYNQYCGFNIYEKYLYLTWIFFSKVIPNVELTDYALYMNCQTIIIETAHHEKKYINKNIKFQNTNNFRRKYKHKISIYWLWYLGLYDLSIENDKIVSVKLTEFGCDMCKMIDQGNFMYMTGDDYIDDYIDGEEDEDKGRDKVNDKAEDEYKAREEGNGENEAEVDKNEYINFMKVLLPEGVVSKTMVTEPIMISGTYTFKVSLDNSVWRKIILSANHTWADLHLIIQDAFDFDNDHLYEFYLDGKKREGRIISVSPIDGSRSSYGIWIGEVDLYERQKIKYLFDFGDEWLFDIKVEKIDKEAEGILEPFIIEKQGNAPEQYPHWD